MPSSELFAADGSPGSEEGRLAAIYGEFAGDVARRDRRRRRAASILLAADVRSSSTEETSLARCEQPDGWVSLDSQAASLLAGQVM